MPTGIRLKRINDRIKRILSLTLLSKMEDPRLAGVFITEVKVDRELDYASIYVSALEGQKRSDEVLKGLKHARGFLRNELANEIDLRVVPKLRFFWDPIPEKADRIENLLAQIREETNPEEAMPEFNDLEEEEYDED